MLLTSRMDAPDTGKLNSDNRFLGELQLRFPDPCRASGDYNMQADR